MRFRYYIIKENESAKGTNMSALAFRYAQREDVTVIDSRTDEQWCEWSNVTWQSIEEIKS